MSMATAKHHEDLVAWQLSEKLRQLVVALTARSEVRRHVRFCDQILRSTESAPSNIAEGFGRFKPREFARFVRIALGSLSETQNHLRAAVNDKKIPQEDFDRPLVPGNQRPARRDEAAFLSPTLPRSLTTR